MDLNQFINWDVVNNQLLISNLYLLIKMGIDW